MKEPGGLQFMGGHKKSDTTERLSTHINATIAVHMACNMLTFSCLARHKSQVSPWPSAGR